MTVTSGTLRVGEAQATMGDLAAHQRGSVWFLYAPLLALFCLAVALGHVLGRGLVMPGVLIASALYFLMLPWLIAIGMRRQFRTHGHSLDLPFRFDTSPESIRYEIGGVTSIAIWNVVDEIFRSRDYWIVMAQSQAFYVPRRIFEGAAMEIEFVREVLSHMTEAARARSIQARNFVGPAASTPTA